MKEIAKAFSDLTKKAREVRDMFSLTEPEVRAFGSSMLVLQADLAKLQSVNLGQLGTFLSEAMEGTIEVFDKFNLNMTKAMDSVPEPKESKKLDDGGGKDNDLDREITSFTDKLKKVGGVLTSAFSKIKSASESAFGGFTTALQGPISALGAFSGPLSMAIDMVSRFVDAVNPALLEQLQMAFDDLYAVIGRALAPVIAAAIPIIRTFADAMVPVVASLIPTFKILADAILSVAGPVIGIFASVITAIQPIWEKMAGAIAQVADMFGSMLLPIIEAMMPAYMALLEVGVSLVPALGELLKAIMGLAEPIISMVVPVLIPVLQALGKVIEWIVKKFSWLIGKITEYAKAIAPERKPSVLKMPKIQTGISAGAASKGASFQNFSDFGKQLMAAAFGTGVGTPEVRTADGVEKLVRLAEKADARDAMVAQPLVINQPARGKF